MVLHKGSCHCRVIQFEVEAPEVLGALECNCSICSMSGCIHHILPKSKFKLLRGEDYITTYTFNTHVAKHTFCKICGVKPFYIPRSNPDGYAINVKCLDPATLVGIHISPFDGVNWELNAQDVAHLSKE